MKPLLIAGLLLMTGCATPSMVGKTDQMLIEKRGLPERKDVEGDETIWQYSHCDDSIGVPIAGMMVNSAPECRKTLYYMKEHVVTRELEVK